MHWPFSLLLRPPPGLHTRPVLIPLWAPAYATPLHRPWHPLHLDPRWAYATPLNPPWHPLHLDPPLGARNTTASPRPTGLTKSSSRTPPSQLSMWPHPMACTAPGQQQHCTPASTCCVRSPLLPTRPRRGTCRAQQQRRSCCAGRPSTTRCVLVCVHIGYSMGGGRRD